MGSGSLDGGGIFSICGDIASEGIVDVVVVGVGVVAIFGLRPRFFATTTVGEESSTTTFCLIFGFLPRFFGEFSVTSSVAMATENRRDALRGVGVMGYKKDAFRVSSPFVPFGLLRSLRSLGPLVLQSSLN